MHILPVVSQVAAVSLEDGIGRRVPGQVMDEIIADAQEAASELKHSRGEKVEQGRDDPDGKSGE